MKMNWKKNLLGYVAIALVFTMVGFAVSTNFAAQAEDGLTSTANTTNTTVVTSPFTDAVSKVQSSVVGVSNYQTVRYSNYGNYGYNWGWGYGYGNGRGNNNDNSTEQEVKAATGSGVVIAENIVLTNYHVVEDASSLKITTPDSEYDATLLAYDENLDVAILKAEGLNLPAVSLGDSDSLLVGDWAICIGNPLGEQFAGTVTVGVVSALNRAVSSSSTDKYGLKETITNSMIQVDAAINSGNSGGGMFNTNGELMGIPTLKYTGSAYSGTTVEGIGMCIPINAAKPLINDVLSGKVTGNATQSSSTASNSNANSSTNSVLTSKPRLGVTIANLNTSSSAVQNGKLPRGVVITEVEDGTPAAEAGLEAWDIIVDVDDNVVSSVSDLTSYIQSKSEGDTVAIKVYRVEDLENYQSSDDIPQGEYLTMNVTLKVVDTPVQQ